MGAAPAWTIAIFDASEENLGSLSTTVAAACQANSALASVDVPVSGNLGLAAALAADAAHRWPDETASLLGANPLAVRALCELTKPQVAVAESEAKMIQSHHERLKSRASRSCRRHWSQVDGHPLCFALQVPQSAQKLSLRERSMAFLVNNRALGCCHRLASRFV